MLREMRLLAALALALLFLSASGLAEPQQLVQTTQETPVGHPYNVGRTAYEQVPLRDDLSARIDQLRSEMLDRIESLDRQQRQLLDERDRQYAQRFAAQQEAVQAALQAAKEAVANALSAAKEAVLKAEDASNKRFEGVNEFRQALNDLSRLQMPRAEAEAVLGTMNEKIGALTSRLDAINNSNQGATETWALIGGGVLFLLAVGTFVMNTRRDQKATK